MTKKLFSFSRFLINSFKKHEVQTSAEEKRNQWSQVVYRAKARERQKKHSIRLVVSVAATLLSAILWFEIVNIRSNNDRLQEAVAQIQVPPQSSDIILMVSDSNAIRVEQDTAIVNYSANGDITVNQKAVDTKIESKKDKNQISYNQIIVPGGKRTMLTLSDSTKIWINAGSRVVFPQKFEEKQREIYVEGEAYLEVHKNPDKPFIVETPDNFNIRVLGTAFNVCTYPELMQSTVVLAEGRIEINGSDKQQKILNPNQFISIAKEGTLGDVIPVDAGDFTGWTKGILIVKSQKFSEVLKRLQIYFGVKMNIDPELNKTISGQLELKDKLDEILKGMQLIVPFDFSLTDDGSYEFKSIRPQQ